MDVASMNEQEVIAALEEQNKRQQKLDQWKSKLEASIEHYLNEYKKACKEAKELFGSDDLKTLREELERRKEENKKTLSEYKSRLDEQEKQLADIQSTLTKIAENNS